MYEKDMLEEANIFEVSLSETVDYDLIHTTSKLVTDSRAEAIQFAETLSRQLEKSAADYIDGVDTDLEKDRIKVSMRELMTEAQALEIA